MAEWSSAYIADLPDSAFACPEQRKYPHHDASGNLDLPHLRAALSRVGDPNNEQCGKAHLQAHAKAEGMGKATEDYAPIFGKAEALDPDEMAGWYAGKHPRRVRIIPFGGPIPSADGKGRDLDGDYFDERTDIKPHWFAERPVLFHHGADPTGVMGDAVLGKATELHMEDDGWWEKVWWTLADARTRRFASLESKGAVLYGSSTPLETPGVRVKRGRDGHIEQWAHAESTLSFSPQNNRAVLRPAKALVEDFAIAQIDALPIAKALVESLDNLGPDLSLTLDLDGDPGDVTAKAGRVLSARNERALREAQELLDRVLALLNTQPEPPTEGDAS